MTLIQNRLKTRSIVTKWIKKSGLKEIGPVQWNQNRHPYLLNCFVKIYLVFDPFHNNITSSKRMFSKLWRFVQKPNFSENSPPLLAHLHAALIHLNLYGGKKLACSKLSRKASSYS